MRRLALGLLFASGLFAQGWKVGGSNAGTSSPSALTTAQFSDPSINSFVTALRSAGTSLVKVLWIGDSQSRDDQTNAGVGPTVSANVAPTVFAKLLQSYGSHGAGLIPLLADGNGTHFDERYTLTGTWTPETFWGPTQGGPLSFGSIFQGAAGATITMSTQYADSFIFSCVQGADSSAGFSVRIDGGAPQTVCNTTGDLSVIRRKVSAGSLANHTLSATVPATGGYGYLYAIEPVAGATGVEVDNAAIGASRTDAWGAYSWQLVFADAAHAENPYNLVVIQLGTNDMIHNPGQTAAQYQANLTAMVTHFKSWANPPAVLILDPPHLNPSYWTVWNGVAQEAYEAANLLVARSYNLPYLSIASRWGPPARAEAAGLFTSDHIHPSDTGAIDIGTAVALAAMGLPVSNTSNAAFSVGADDSLLMPLLKSNSGTRYLCIDSSGKVTSSATACSGS